MQIRGIGYGLQSSLRGNVVNVENNLDICAKVLPRAFDDTATIQVKLMRKMNYKVPYMYDVIRPQAVLDAAKHLVRTDLYKKHEVSLSQDWINSNEGKKQEC